MSRARNVLRESRSRWFVLLLLSALLAMASVAWSLVPGGGVASGQVASLPPNDLLPTVSNLQQGGGQTPATVPVQENAEPPLEATPRAVCGPGSHPLQGMQGRVPASALNSPEAAHGYTCNLAEVAHQGSSGGFKVLRYVDTQGHVCAFYDTALLYPINALQSSGPSLGVAVLDMSDPSHPVQTDTLNSLPMQSPHESLSLNQKRGLLAAVLGNPATYPGLVSIYDVSQDCRHPVLDSTSLVAKFGHEGNFSPDGKTFYAAGTAVKVVTAIDVTDPKNPRVISQINEYSHGLTISDDGNRAYVADPINGQLLILDTSQIQARKPNPQVKEISRLTWKTYTIPQNAIPMTIHGHPYILEFDEYAFRFNSQAPPDTVGAARIIDISDEQHPRVVSNLRLEVNQPSGHHEASGDPGDIDPAQGYAAHYCNIPQEVDPGIVACSFITSGLRIFDIRDPLHPKEVGYFVAPPHKQPENGYDGSNFAMSKPAFDPANRDVWYTDGSSGFYVLHLTKQAWPSPDTAAAGVPGCPVPTGRLAGRRLGPLRLGQARGRVRRRLAHFSTRRRASMDFYCLAGGGVRAGYPSGRLLRSLRRGQRSRVAGRIVIELTADRFYALSGVRPGAKLAMARRRLHLVFHARIGRNVWYLARGRQADGVLKVRHGVVEEVGLANKRLASSHPRRFLASFN